MNTLISFSSFTQSWILKLVSCSAFIINQGALQKVEQFLQDCHSSLPTLPVPLIIEKKSYEELCEATQIILQVQKKIIKKLLETHSHAEILSLFNLPLLTEPLIDWEELRIGEKIISRFDFIPTEKGYQLCEINADSSIGGLKFSECFHGYCDTLGWNEPKNLPSPREQIAKVLRDLVLKNGFTRVLIFSLKQYVHEGSGTVLSLHRRVREVIPEVPVLLVDEENFPREFLTPEEAKKTLIYRLAMYDDLPNDSFIKEIRQTGISLLNSYETEMRSNKSWLSLFHREEFQKYLTSTERDVIDKFIPFTISISENQVETLLSEKNQYVFKMNRSYGGDGVYIGEDHDSQTLKNLLSDPSAWSAQELIQSEKIMLPEDSFFNLKEHKLVLGLFNILGHCSGVLVRASASNSIVNMKHGNAKIGWAFPISTHDRDLLLEDFKRFSPTIHHP